MSLSESGSRQSAGMVETNAGAAGGTGSGVRHRLRARDGLFAGDARTLFLAGLRTADVAVVVVSALVAWWVRAGPYGPDQTEAWEIVAGALLTANAMHSARVYSLDSLNQRLRHVRRLVCAWMFTVLAVIALTYFTKTAADVSRGWTLTWAALGVIGLLAVRVGAWHWLSARGGRQKIMPRVAVLDSGFGRERLAARLRLCGESGMDVIGVFKLDGRSGEASAPSLDDLLQLARRKRIDEIAIAVPCAQATAVASALTKLGTVPTTVKLWPDLGASPSLPLCPSVPVLERPLAGWPVLVKRSVDVLISCIFLVALSPVMAVIALLIKWDSAGPVVFRQQRCGFNQNVFTVYKFRTMVATAALDRNVPQARRGDPRVTRVGAFLRRTSLDELPQLLNVIEGSMSLVGPRPHAVVHDQHYARLIDGYLRRHRVRPGLTGWAQINGCRGETDTLEKMVRRVEYDLSYIDDWSPLLDVYILLRTAVLAFHDGRAY